MIQGRLGRLLRQHERLRRARENAFLWCGVFVLLFIPAFASLLHELSGEAEPRILGQLILIALAVPVIFLTFRSGQRHRRALQALTSRDKGA